MAKVSVLGLGNMGAAIAWAFHKANHDLVVWNRSSERSRPFADADITVAENPVDAIAASSFIVVCVDSNPVADSFLQADDVAAVLGGRTVVQFSTSTPKEAEASATWLASRSAHYIDGAIHCSPGHIGTDDAAFLLSGDKNIYGAVRPFLACLGGDQTFIGETVRAASALELASVCEVYGRFAAVSHAALICEAEGIPLDQLAALMPEGGFSQRYVETIRDGAFENPGATLRIWDSAIQRVRAQGHDAGIDTRFPDYLADLFNEAINDGLADEHVMALIKVLRKA
ncbi:MAG: 6-phosphogluconate dehydrogenase [Rhodospirillaceae bacterium]|nr:6-phosphogluconate dehydrogenase [Rhodospirillaceae bacterium]